jgi:hypothetical protein
MPTWATPLPYNDLYLLRTWSPEQAESVIELLQAYPDTLYPTPNARDTIPYNNAFTYVAFLQREALLRYPDDALAEGWRWGLAYNLAHTTDPGVAGIYAGLIQEVLDKGRVPLEELPLWFNQHEPHLSLSIYRFTPPPGYLNRVLFEIKAAGGAAYLWLVESPEKTTIYPLVSFFDFAHSIQMHFTTGDLTGDGVEELAVYADSPPGQTIPELPQVFSLVTGDPPRVQFGSEIPIDLGTDFRMTWSIDQGLIQSTATIYPACAVHVSRTYAWDGNQLVPGEVKTQVETNPTQLGYCEGVIDHIASQWSPDIAIPLMETLQPDWPPLTDPDGKSYPADAQDGWRYRLGVYHALSGHFELAQQTLTDLISSPTATDSSWIVEAQNFLQAYTSPEDLYKACLPAKFCDPRQALQQSLNVGGYREISTALDALIRGGVIVRSSGNFDFDSDGEAERWVLLRHRPQEKLEFWILARWESGVRALFIEQVDSTETRPYFHEPLDTPPIAQIGPKRGFVFSRLPVTRQPYLIRKEVEFIPTTFTLDALRSSIADLFSGTDPVIIRGRLEELEKSDRFNCSNYQICDLFYYTLGLVYELTGDIRPAIDTYIKLWWENTGSPFMLIARLKLNQLPYKPPTLTSAPTPTRTLTPTAGPSTTPSITPTTDPNATPSITPTNDPNATPSETPTETLTPTETPTPTDTLTSTP